jgi:DNA-binding TFAR19-related protein (PDSD5 family)
MPLKDVSCNILSHESELTQTHSAAVKRVKLVKRELVEKVEKFLEQQALGGKLRSQVGDADIVDLLNKVGSATSAEPKIIIARKRYGEEDEDDDDSDLR